MELFFFDIETCGEYKDYDTFLDSDERGAKLFASKYEKSILKRNNVVIFVMSTRSIEFINTFKWKDQIIKEHKLLVDCEFLKSNNISDTIGAGD